MTDWKILPLKELLSEGVKNGYSPVCGDEPTGRWILSLGAVSQNGLVKNAKEAGSPG